MPAGVVIGGRSLVLLATALVTTAILAVIGWLAYGAVIPIQALPALVITIIVGTLSFCALGYALASVIRDADSAQPVIQAVVLPLYFI